MAREIFSFFLFKLVDPQKTPFHLPSQYIPYPTRKTMRFSHLFLLCFCFFRAEIPYLTILGVQESEGIQKRAKKIRPSPKSTNHRQTFGQKSICPILIYKEPFLTNPHPKEPLNHFCFASTQKYEQTNFSIPPRIQCSYGVCLHKFITLQPS